MVIANNEANAAAMASGAKQAQRNCLVAMKSMGLHVAADALSVGHFASNTGESGVVVVVGDDPWSSSTSTAADSRYLFKHLHIPFLEPSTPEELKNWVGMALTISRQSGIYQGLILTTPMAEGGGRVEVGEEAIVTKETVELSTEEFDLNKLVMVPPNSLKADKTMNEVRFPQAKKILSSLNLDQSFGVQESEIGFISAGIAFETLKEVLQEKKYLEKYALYKTASSYPLNEKKLLPWCLNKKAIVVVEEKRGFLEAELAHLLSKEKI